MKKTKMNKAQLRHAAWLKYNMLHYLDPYNEIYEQESRLGGNYYDYVDRYGENVINTDKRKEIINDILIPELKKDHSCGEKRYKQSKYVLLLCIEFHEDTYIENLFQELEEDLFEHEVEDKKGFLEIVYWELFHEDPALSKYIQGDVPVQGVVPF